MRASEFVPQDIELRHEPTSTGGVEVHAYRDGQQVGWVRFQKLKNGQVKAAMVHVPERLRRQGIGTAMYSYARDELGLDIVPSDNQTDLGRAFWNKLHEGSVLDAQSLVDVFVRGRHGSDIVTRVIAREFPNQKLDRLIQLLVDKYDVNPNAIVYGPSRKTTTTNQSVSEQELEERKKRRKQSRWAFSGPGGWYGYYYGHSGEGAASGDGGGGESVRENSSLNSNVIFLNDTAAVVGQEHGRPLKLSAEDKQRIQDIAREHGAWYEGNGMDQEFTKGVIDDYQGSWDDDLLSPAVEGYPAAFLYVLFSNIKENDTVKGKIGSDPDSTIFDRILDTQPSTNYFPDRRFDAETLAKFLKAVSEGSYDFVQMSQAPATEQNVAKFFKLGERLMWPSNWEEYPNRAGRVAKSVNDLRDKFLASRKHGVYVTGSDHLIAVRELLNQNKQDLAENFADGKVKGKSRPGRVKRSGASCAGSVTDLRARAKKYGGERGRMYHWCANMKSGRKK